MSFVYKRLIAYPRRSVGSGFCPPGLPVLCPRALHDRVAALFFFVALFNLFAPGSMTPVDNFLPSSRSRALVSASFGCLIATPRVISFLMNLSMERHTCLMIFIFIIYGGFSLYAVVTSLYAVTYSLYLVPSPLYVAAFSLYEVHVVL